MWAGTVRRGLIIPGVTGGDGGGSSTAERRLRLAIGRRLRRVQPEEEAVVDDEDDEDESFDPFDGVAGDDDEDESEDVDDESDDVDALDPLSLDELPAESELLVDDFFLADLESFL
jgi:hypothetical protein